MNERITQEDLRGFARAFAESRVNRVAQNCVTSGGILTSARRYDAVRDDVPAYSVSLKQRAVSDQKQTGRCWMFAGLNLLRDRLMEKWGLEDFQLSGNYLMFYDKLERANLYLEGCLDLLDRPLFSREHETLLNHVRSDGGWWEMFVNLVKKYGVVPQSAQPETACTASSREMDTALTERLQGFARDLRRGHEAGRSADDLRRDKEEMLSVIYRMLAICLGEPVRRFDFKARGKDDRWLSDCGVTPREFYDRYIGVDLDEYIALGCIASGGAELKKYAWPMFWYGDVIEGGAVDYVSVPPETLRSVTVAQLKASEPVCFDCDVGEASWREGGLLDDRLYDLSGLFSTDFPMDRRERFLYGQAELSHAMTFKGVDLDGDGRPIRWRVENSWGDRCASDGGEKGMFLMSDGWFGKYVYRVIARRAFIPRDILNTYDNTEAELLPPWHPGM